MKRFVTYVASAIQFAATSVLQESLPHGVGPGNKAMKPDRRANGLLRNTSAIKLLRARVPSRRPLIAKPLRGFEEIKHLRATNARSNFHRGATMAS